MLSVYIIIFIEDALTLTLIMDNIPMEVPTLTLICYLSNVDRLSNSDTNLVNFLIDDLCNCFSLGYKLLVIIYCHKKKK